MSKFLKAIATTSLLTLAATPALSEGFGLGRAALASEIAAWDKDIAPDGTGLPVGAGSVEAGERIFSETCASCHGEFAEGSGNWPKLAGGENSLADEDPLKTVGSYWPYLSTVYDYVRRSMPFGAAQSLSDDDVYAITAYILYSNYLVEDDFVLSNENFLEVEMPNAAGFILDDRAQTEYPRFREANACYENCKDSVEITMRASVLDVTPSDPEQNQNAQDAATNERAQVVAATDAAPAMAIADPALVAAGEKVFKKCKACHKVGEGAKNGTGPLLTGIIGQAAGQVEGFKYSRPMQDAAAAGLVWTDAELAAFLTKPRDYMKGTKMSFAGLRKKSDIAAVIAYLSSFK
ncbi:MAG: c-type cytochrome [Maritimibacter sp.]